ncbi:MAG: hypothetical protein F9K09_04305 [Flavobacteriales bacterium]|nr:MAG: hypothetical protein F9K09_04305 [Flavobacteriales bacterium]
MKSEIAILITLNKILKEEFTTQEAEEVRTLLAKHELDKILNKTIELIRNTLKDSDLHIKAFGFIQINHIAASLLIEVNETLRKLDKHKTIDKFSLESNVGRLCSSILSKVIEKQEETEQIKIVNSLLITLNDVCKYKEYNLEELLSFLRIKSQAAKNVAGRKSENVVLPSSKESRNTPGYKWNGKKEESFEKFISKLVELKICEESERFKLLFKKPNKNLAISLNNSKPDYVLQFLCCVKECGLISCFGNKNQGFYQVLQTHVKNFDDVFLKFKTPREAMDRVKKLKNYNDNKNKFDKTLKEINH